MLYLVQLEITIGEYEKHTHHLVKAKDEKSAGLLALQGEAHNELTPHDDNPEVVWDDHMIYNVYEVKPVAAKDASTLKRYFNVWEG